MSASARCPECRAPISPDRLESGRAVRCRRCNAVFSPRDAVRTARDNDDDLPPERRRHGTGLLLVVACAVVGFVGLLIGGGVLVWFLMARKADGPPVVQVEPAPKPVPVDADPLRPIEGAGPPPAMPDVKMPDFPPPEPVRLKGPRDDPGIAMPELPPDPGLAQIGPGEAVPRPPNLGPVNFKVPLPPARVEMTPAAVKDRVATISLPSPAKDVCVGGDGRFLLFLLSAQRQIAVVDVCAAKVVKFLPVADDPAFIAAGMEKLIVVYPQKGLIQKWNLLTLEREVTAPLPDLGTIARVAMGSASAGPIYLSVKKNWDRPVQGLNLQAIDLATLKVLRANTGGNFSVGTHPDYPAAIHVSADGTTIGMYQPGLSPMGIQVVTAKGDTLTSVYEHNTAGALIPGPDGSVIFTSSGLYGRDARPRGEEKAGGLLLPAVHDGYHLKVDGLNPFRFDERNAKPAVGVFMTGDTRPLVTLRDVDGLDMPQDRFGGGSGPILTAEKRIHYVPRAEALVTVNAAADKVFVRRLNIDETIEASGVDYLYVKSVPIADAERGSEYVYPVVVKSKKGGVKIKLESGPDGMKVTDTTVRWRVPVALGESEARVVLTASDATGQEVLHSFTVRVHDAGKAPKPAATAKPVPPSRPGKGEPLVALKPSPPTPSAVRPPALKDDKVTIKLPTPAAEDACFGGGGRFLILRLPATQKLAVFDVNEAKVVKYIAVAEADAKFAAGLNHLIVAMPAAGVFQRWSLTTFEKEASVASPVAQIGNIAMGSASDGPLLVQPRSQDRFGGSAPGTFKLLDPRTFQESDLKVVTKRSPHSGDDYQMGVAKRPMMSADGRVICGCGVYVRTLNGYESTPAHDHSTPGPEGRYLYGPGRIQTGEGAQVGALHFAHGKGVWNYAAAQGPYYFSLNQIQLAGGGSRSKAELKLHTAGDRREVYTHSDQSIFDPLFEWHSGSGVFGSHVFCVPDAELLIVLSKAGDELILSKLDWKKGLEKAGRDLLYLADSPPPAERGSAYKYLPAVRSTKGGVKARLETSPEGMTLTPDGITWDVPRGFAESPAEVLLTLTDASGQEQFHSLHIVVYDAGKAPKTAAGAVGPAAKAAAVPDLVALKPATAAGPFKPADLPGGKATVKLPGRVKDVCYGGGGRYLILALPDVKQLAVFDATAGKVAKYIPLAEADSKIAASLSYLVVAAPDAQVLQRWSLKTFEKEVTVPCPVKVGAIAMGHDVDGPVVIAEAPRDRFGDGGPLALFDPKTFKKIEIKAENGPGGLGPHGRFDGSTIPLRVSANGELITGAAGAYRLQGTTLTRLAAPPGFGTADGTHILNIGTIHTTEGKQVGQMKGGHGQMVWYYPAADAPFFFSVNQLPERRGTGRGWIDVRLHIGGDQRDVVTFTDDSIFKSLVDWTSGVPPFDRHIFVMPRAKLLIVMPLTADSLEVRRLDPEEAIRKSDKDVIAVLSRPDPARKGEVFRYLPHVVSPKGGAKAKLESGPEGMKLTPDGLEWYVPPGFAEPEVKVLMLLTDASGAEAYHSFTVPVQGK